MCKQILMLQPDAFCEQNVTAAGYPTGGARAPYLVLRGCFAAEREGRKRKGWKGKDERRAHKG